MNILGEKRALEMLGDVREKFRGHIRETYEPRAKNCLTCETQGACCIDAHFVNVRISRLEAAAIRDVLTDLPREIREAVFVRVEKVVAEYGLAAGSNEKFACPLFEKGIGCLAHTVKPLPCIQHACYDRAEDLPPDELLGEAEDKVERLNRRVYGKASLLVPLPVAIGNHLPANRHE
ncbi:MAG: hypothetical protein ACRD43_00060 [Pyrinomonadaceae bacterium]